MKATVVTLKAVLEARGLDSSGCKWSVGAYPSLLHRPLSKKTKIRSWVPSPQMPYFLAVLFSKKKACKP